MFSEWLHCLYDKLLDLAAAKKSQIEEKIVWCDRSRRVDEWKLILEQIDCFSRANQMAPKRAHKKSHDLAKSILKSSWIYLIDVLTGCLTHTDLSDVEKILFYDREPPPTSTTTSTTPTTTTTSSSMSLNQHTSGDLVVDNSDFSFCLFSLRSTLDSLYRLLKLVAGLPAMDNELTQMFFILIDTNFFQNGSLCNNATDEISLNKIICLDFVFFSCLSLVCDLTGLLGKTHPKLNFFKYVLN